MIELATGGATPAPPPVLNPARFDVPELRMRDLMNLCMALRLVANLQPYDAGNKTLLEGYNALAAQLNMVAGRSGLDEADCWRLYNVISPLARLAGFTVADVKPLYEQKS